MHELNCKKWDARQLKLCIFFVLVFCYSVFFPPISFVISFTSQWVIWTRAHWNIGHIWFDAIADFSMWIKCYWIWNTINFYFVHSSLSPSPSQFTLFICLLFISNSKTFCHCFALYDLNWDKLQNRATILVNRLAIVETHSYDLVQFFNCSPPTQSFCFPKIDDDKKIIIINVQQPRIADAAPSNKRIKIQWWENEFICLLPRFFFRFYLFFLDQEFHNNRITFRGNRIGDFD